MATRMWLGGILLAIALASVCSGQGTNSTNGTGDPMAYHQDNNKNCQAYFDNWGKWSDCNAPCNKAGQKVRYRHCIRPSSCPHANCQGKDMETYTCTGDCRHQVDPHSCSKGDQKGGWGNWGCWSKCNKNNIKIRYRLCNKPEPIGDYSYCHGTHEDKASCQYSYPTPVPSHNPYPNPDPYPRHNPYPDPPYNSNPNNYNPNNYNPDPYPSNPYPSPSPHPSNPYPSNPNPYPSNPNNYPSNPYPSNPNPSNSYPSNPNPSYPNPNPSYPNPSPRHNVNPYPQPSHNPYPDPNPSYNPNPNPHGNPNNYPHNNLPPAVCVKGKDIVFAVDASGSIGKDRYKKMTDSLLQMISAMHMDNSQRHDNDKVRTGIIVFSDYARVVKHLNSYTVPTYLSYDDGTTNTAAAIEKAYTSMFHQSYGDRPYAENYLVVLTDGQSSDISKTKYAADVAKSKGINIIAVGIGDGVDIKELENMASHGPKTVFLVDFDKFYQVSNMFKCDTYS